MPPGPPPPQEPPDAYANTAPALAPRSSPLGQIKLPVTPTPAAKLEQPLSDLARVRTPVLPFADFRVEGSVVGGVITCGTSGLNAVTL
jgi:hypothetical protein